MEPAAFQSELQCPNCAGQCVYDPAVQALSCLSCGNVQGLETDADDAAAAEFPFDPDAPVAEAPMTIGAQVHRCETCGGAVSFVGPSISERCAYCDGPVVLDTQDSAYAAMALIPFRVPEQDAQKFAQTWVRRRIAAPSDLNDVVAKARVAGLYVPFWTFDSQEAVDYWANYKVRQGKRTVVRKTSGSMHMSFDDMLVPASRHVTPLIRDGILHDFSPTRLRPYRAGYLAGFAAEQHHQNVADGLDASADDKRLLIRNRIKRHIRKSGVHGIRYNTDTSGIHYRRILLPVWILHYSYKGKAKKVVVCGMQGRTYGERAFSQWKLAGYAALLSALAIGFGLAWGAAGLL
ncbi:hypothetical protein [uncultured Tateyamaria sp.]|uniref:hypothetical protein n=1 Tax=uncultured Tateyamaria sp. TaxID=455651 RepID=UPI00261D6396|nr:hypothetical protein [uncultured Tateyamaria sp.]